MIGDQVHTFVLVDEADPEHPESRDLTVTIQANLWKSDHPLHPFIRMLSAAITSYDVAKVMSEAGRDWTEDDYLPPVEVEIAGVKMRLRALSMQRKYKDHKDD